MNDPTIDPSGPGVTQPASAQEFQLAPLTTGQVLDRTFALYRSHFLLFAGLAVFPAAVSLLFGLVRIAYLLATHTPLDGSGGAPLSRPYLVNLGLVLVGGFFRICVYGISVSATTWCIARIYLGEPATMKSGFDFAFRKWFRYLLLAMAQFWFAFWLPTLAMFAAVILAAVAGSFGGIGNLAAGFLIVAVVIGYLVWLVISSIRVALAIPVCVVEGQKIVASIRRSRALLVSRKVRIFLLFLFMVALESVLFSILLPMAILLPKMGPNGHLIYQLTTLLLGFIYGVLVSPIAAVGLCLFYFDERVRREGFDIEYLMSRSAPPPPPAPEAIPIP
jgi:hypothetical protein